MFDAEEKLTIKYIPLNQALAWTYKDNTKLHDIGSICEAIRRYGYNDPPKFDSTLNGGALLYGNGRIEALAWMKSNDWVPPRGIGVDDDTGDWYVPVVFGVDADSQAAAEAAAIDHNSITLLGGGFSLHDISHLYKSDTYLGMLDKLALSDGLPVSVDAEDLKALHYFASEQIIDMSPIMTSISETVDGGADLAAEVEQDVANSDDVSKRWPQIKARMRPDLYDIYLDITDDYGENDDERMEGLLLAYKKKV